MQNANCKFLICNLHFAFLDHVQGHVNLQEPRTKKAVLSSRLTRCAALGACASRTTHQPTTHHSLLPHHSEKATPSHKQRIRINQPIMAVCLLVEPQKLIAKFRRERKDLGI